MSDEPEKNCGDPECDCGCGKGEDCDCEEWDIVELEDENGDTEQFAVLEEVDFEDRRFVVLAPLAEVEAAGGERGEGEGDPELNIVIYEVDGDDFTQVEDDDLSERIFEHLNRLMEEEDEDEEDGEDEGE